MDGSVENIYSTYDNKTLYITGESMRKFFKIMDEGNLKMNIKVHTIYAQPDCDVTLRFNVVNELIGAENAKRVADEAIFMLVSCCAFVNYLMKKRV